jgi:hypothetical protein
VAADYDPHQAAPAKRPYREAALKAFDALDN